MIDDWQQCSSIALQDLHHKRSPTASLNPPQTPVSLLPAALIVLSATKFGLVNLHLYAWPTNHKIPLEIFPTHISNEIIPIYGCRSVEIAVSEGGSLTGTVLGVEQAL
jgi:hypothetical protein